MKGPILTCIFGAILLAFHNSNTASTNTAPRLTIELRDGTRLVGEGVQKELNFHSDSFGDFKFELDNIRYLESASNNITKVLTLKGDSISASLLDAKLTVKTSFGNIAIPTSSIYKISVGSIDEPNHRRFESGSSTRPQSGLIALWSGDNKGKDTLGKHDAMVSADITYVQAKTGQGFDFDGGENSLIISNSPDLNFNAGQDFSIEGWVKPLLPPPATTDDMMTILDKRNAPNYGEHRGYELVIWHGQFHFRMSSAAYGDGSDWISTGPDLRDGNFHHVAVTVARNDTDGGKLYVDGQLILTFDPTNQSGDLTNDAPLQIGKHSDPHYRCFFNGVIDTLAIYNRVLTADEIKSISIK